MYEREQKTGEQLLASFTRATLTAPFLSLRPHPYEIKAFH